MKYLFAALSLVLLAGCAGNDEEDKAFYYSGWLTPEKGANQRLMRGSHESSPISTH